MWCLRVLYIGLLLFAATFAAHGAVLFDEDFSSDGNLDGYSPDVGGNWSVASGSLTVSGGAVDTFNGNTAIKLAYASFSRALGAGETLRLTFQTVNSGGTFATTPGWVGLSLYTGGSGGTEQFFFGSPGNVAGWGLAGGQAGGDTSVVPAQTAEAAIGLFTYEYDTGNYTYSVAGGYLSGTVAANLALNTIRIGADINNLASMAVSDINITDGSTAIPEPATLAMMGIAMACLIGMRKKRKRHAYKY